MLPPHCIPTIVYPIMRFLNLERLLSCSSSKLISACIENKSTQILTICNFAVIWGTRIFSTSFSILKLPTVWTYISRELFGHVTPSWGLLCYNMQRLVLDFILTDIISIVSSFLFCCKHFFLNFQVVQAKILFRYSLSCQAELQWAFNITLRYC